LNGLPYPFDRLKERAPLAPVVCRNGQWCYEAAAPADFFSREAFLRELLRYYMGVRKERPDGERWDA
jgi:hypothetical protein